MGAKRTTFQNPETGRWRRICCNCKKEKDLKRCFYKARRKRTGKLVDYGYQCKVCQRARVKAYSAQPRVDPVKGPEIREYYTRLMREWRRRNPERSYANVRSYIERVRQNPIRHARYLEGNRIAYRLRAEREGRQVVRSSSTARMAPEARPHLPVAPLVEVMLDMHSHGFEIEELCEKAGITSRTFRRWRTGEIHGAKLAVAERAALGLGLDAEVLWPDVEGVAA